MSKKMKTNEAVYFTGENQDEILRFAYPSMTKVGYDGAKIMKLPVYVPTNYGDQEIKPGEWAIKIKDRCFVICTQRICT